MVAKMKKKILLLNILTKEELVTLDYMKKQTSNALMKQAVELVERLKEELEKYVSRLDFVIINDCTFIDGDGVVAIIHGKNRRFTEARTAIDAIDAANHNSEK
jgi:hypothetical protein